MKKTLQELTIKDNFMFGAVMTDESICREFLEMALGIPIGRVVVDREKSLVYHPEYKGIRLDVYARDENQTLFNVEMQVASVPALGRRARYYSSELDMTALISGRNYEKLPDSYVIFVCDFDPFGISRYRYTFANICKENNELSLGDGRQIVFLSTRGKNSSEVPDSLVKFLDYVGTGQTQNTADSNDNFITRLQNAVQKVKTSRDMEGRFMILQEMLQEERTKGHTEGFAEGHAKGHAEGLADGMKEGILILLSLKGSIPPELREQIKCQTDSNILERWFKLASKTDSIETFRAGM